MKVDQFSSGFMLIQDNNKQNGNGEAGRNLHQLFLIKYFCKNKLPIVSEPHSIHIFYVSTYHVTLQIIQH